MLEGPVPLTPSHLKESVNICSTLETNLSSNMKRQRPVITDFMFLNTNTEGTGTARKFSYRFTFKQFVTIL